MQFVITNTYIKKTKNIKVVFFSNIFGVIGSYNKLLKILVCSIFTMALILNHFIPSMFFTFSKSTKNNFLSINDLQAILSINELFAQ